MGNTSDNVRNLLLEGWEDVYKKSQLTLWILLALKHGEKSMSDIKSFIIEKTNNILEADDKSMYRALRRFDEADLIAAKTLPNAAGPDIKMWHLTETGIWLLETFIEKHIKGVFLNPQNKNLFS